MYPRPSVDREESSGLPTPSHGGTVQAGNEYDMPVLTRERTPPTPQDQPRPRQNQPAARQRPLSMPPQSAAAAAEASPARHESRRERREERHERHERERDRDRDRERQRTKIVGDYTLGKTLGAGSMGKVKLATHNQTGEKVRATTLTSALGTLTPSAARDQNSAPRAGISIRGRFEKGQGREQGERHDERGGLS